MTPAPGLAAALREVAADELRQAATLEKLGMVAEAAKRLAAASAYHAYALQLEVSR